MLITAPVNFFKWRTY